MWRSVVFWNVVLVINQSLGRESAIPCDQLPPASGFWKADLQTSLHELYAQYPWGDLWVDAQIEDTLAYVRGSKLLLLPSGWRRALPKMLPEDTEASDID